MEEKRRRGSLTNLACESFVPSSIHPIRAAAFFNSRPSHYQDNGQLTRYAPKEIFTTAKLRNTLRSGERKGEYEYVRFRGAR